MLRAFFLMLLGTVTAACGNKIGDSCNVSSDCAQDGSRMCDTTSPGGTCTIVGCDYGTCPDEAVCVRFFPALSNDAPACGQGCEIDEVCTVAGKCAPRSIEQRFCMLTCDGDGDCRDSYECRKENTDKSMDLRVLHGGEPVPNPQTPENVPSTGFCAARLRCSVDEDCGDPNYRCSSDYCVKR